MTLGQTTAGRDLRQRLLLLGGAMLFGLLVLAVRLYRLQITRGDEFVQKSVTNAVRAIPIPADRGMILDSRKEILVDNRPSFDVVITPAFCLHCYDDVIPKLAVYLGWDAAQVTKVEARLKAVKRDSIFRPVRVLIDLTRDDPERVKLDTLYAHKLDLPGVDVIQAPHRNYRSIFTDKDGKPAYGLAHLIGYLNEINEDERDRFNAIGANYQLGDYVGRIGVEKFAESQLCDQGQCMSALRGVDGERKEVVDARGQPLPIWNGLLGADSTRDPVPGHNLVLSIDARLQQEAETKFKGTAGAVVAIDVRTGFILAMLARPAFDPNLMTGRVTPAQLDAMSKDPLQPLVFRAVQQQYSPGSTFKPIAMLAALRTGQFNAHTLFHCSGGYRMGNRTWRCFRESGHGTIDIKSAITMSCDAFFYHVGDAIGLEAMANTALELGLGRPTGIGVVQEVPGIMPTVAYYDRVLPGGYQKYTAINSAVGQGDDTFTPMQVLIAYSAIANGGTVFQPQVIKRVESVDGQLIHEFAPKVARKVNIDPEHRRILIEGLTGVVNEPTGTGYWARLKEIKMAGKTGTAQVKKLGAQRLASRDFTKVSYWERDNAWFVGFAPADDPEIAVVTLSEHAGFGGAEAAPTVAAVIQKYFDLKKESDLAMANASVPWSPPEVRPRPAAPKPRVEAPPAPAPADKPDEAPPAKTDDDPPAEASSPGQDR